MRVLLLGWFVWCVKRSYHQEDRPYVRRSTLACNRNHPACNRTHAACSPTYLACRPTHPACRPYRTQVRHFYVHFGVLGGFWLASLPVYGLLISGLPSWYRLTT